MDVAADTVLLHTDHKGNFAVCFKSNQTIDHMTACLLQHLSPVNVIFLIKTSLKLHQHGYLFAIVRRLCQRRDDRRISADPVQGLLDSQHLGIPGSTAHKIHHRIKTLVWMVEQDVSPADIGEDIILIHQSRHWLRPIFSRLEVLKAVQTIHFHQKGEIQRAGDREDILAADQQFFLYDLKKALIYVRFDFQTDRFAPLALFELFLNLLQQIHRLLLVNGEIGVAHDAEGMGSDDIVVQEQRRHIPLYNLLQKHHHPLLCPILIDLLRQFHDPLKHRRHLNHGKFHFPVPVLLL